MRADLVLMTYGEPYENRFADQYEYSKLILNKLTRRVAPIPKFVTPLLAAWRGRQRVKDWNDLGYTSPLESISEQQRDALLAELRKQDPDTDWHIHIAYEFRHPLQHEVLDTLRNQALDRLMLLPMYATVSDFTHGITRSDFLSYQEKHNQPFESHVPMLCLRPFLDELADVMAQYVRDEAQKRGYSDEEKKSTALLLGCHGTVMTPPKGIKNTGYGDTFGLYQRLERRLRDEFSTVRIGWLNHTLGGEWTSPNAEQSVSALVEEGYTRFMYFPFGFLADNAESQVEGRQVMEDHGIAEYDHLDCVNTYPPLITMLANVIRQQLQEPHIARQARQEEPKPEPEPQLV